MLLLLLLLSLAVADQESQLAWINSVFYPALRGDGQPGDFVCGQGASRFVICQVGLGITGLVASAGEAQSRAPYLSGTIHPAWRTMLPEFQYLDIENQAVHGPLPPLPPKMQQLFLTNNSLDSALPPLPETLRWIKVASNRLSGPINMSPLPNLQVCALIDTQDAKEKNCYECPPILIAEKCNNFGSRWDPCNAAWQCTPQPSSAPSPPSPASPSAPSPASPSAPSPPSPPPSPSSPSSPSPASPQSSGNGGAANNGAVIAVVFVLLLLVLLGALAIALFFIMRSRRRRVSSAATSAHVPRSTRTRSASRYSHRSSSNSRHASMRSSGIF